LCLLRQEIAAASGGIRSGWRCAGCDWQMCQAINASSAPHNRRRRRGRGRRSRLLLCCPGHGNRSRRRRPRRVLLYASSGLCRQHPTAVAVLLTHTSILRRQASLQDTGQDRLPILVSFASLEVEAVSTRWLFQAQPVIEASIHPSKPLRLQALTWSLQLDFCQRPHLAVNVRVTQQELLALPAAQIAIAPVRTEGLFGLADQSPLEAQELLKKRGLQFQIWSP